MTDKVDSAIYIYDSERNVVKTIKLKTFLSRVNNVLRNEKGKNCLALIPGIILKRFARTFSPSQKFLFLKSEFIYIILHA